MIRRADQGRTRRRIHANLQKPVSRRHSSESSNQINPVWRAPASAEIVASNGKKQRGALAPGVVSGHNVMEGCGGGAFADRVNGRINEADCRDSVLRGLLIDQRRKT